MESISSLTKMHCRSINNILTLIVLIAMALLSSVMMVISFSVNHLVFFLYSLYTTVAIGFYIAGKPSGCKMLRFPFAFLTVIFFTLSFVFLAIGFSFIYQHNAKEYINSILENYGYNLAITPKALGMAVILIGLVTLFLSFCLLAGVRYFGSIIKCLDGHIKRGGAKLFSSFAVFTFAVVSIAMTAQIIYLFRNGSLQRIAAYPNYIVFIEVVLYLFSLLFMGLSANEFDKKTYAFKVFENQMMKVEKNADGTVYVPIKEEREYYYTDANAESQKSEASAAADKNADNTPKDFITHKPFIPEGQVIVSTEHTPDSVRNESDII